MFLASEELSPEKNGTKSGIHTQGKLLAKPLASLYVPGQEPFLPPCVLASMVRVCKLGRDSHSARHTVTVNSFVTTAKWIIFLNLLKPAPTSLHEGHLLLFFHK